MSLIQEAAILAGDWITQPIRAKIASFSSGKKMEIVKHVEEGALMGDGSINPNIRNEMDAAMLAFKTNRVVYVASRHEKRVTWEIIEKQS